MFFDHTCLTMYGSKSWSHIRAKFWFWLFRKKKFFFSLSPPANEVKIIKFHDGLLLHDRFFHVFIFLIYFSTQGFAFWDPNLVLVSFIRFSTLNKPRTYLSRVLFPLQKIKVQSSQCLSRPSTFYWYRKVCYVLCFFLGMLVVINDLHLYSLIH